VEVIENGSAAIMDIIEIVKAIFTGVPQGKRLFETVDSVLPLSRPARAIPPAPTLAEMALLSFFGSAFFGILIQDNDEIFEIIFRRDYSPKVIEVYVFSPLSKFSTYELSKERNTNWSINLSDNGKPLTIQELQSFLVNARKMLFNRRLSSQSYIVNIGDNLGQTGQVAHSAKISAIQDGVEATASIVSIAEIIFVTDSAEMGGGHREILMKSFVFAVDAWMEYGWELERADTLNVFRNRKYMSRNG
jgi:hypothetical protein